MKIGEITQSETLYELKKWAQSQVPFLEDGMTAEKVSKSILQRAIAKFKKQPEPSEEKNKEMDEYMDNLQQMMGTDE